MTLTISMTGWRAELFTLQDLMTIPAAAAIIADIRAAFPALDEARVAHEFVRRLIGLLIEDVNAETARRLAKLYPL